MQQQQQQQKLCEESFFCLGRRDTWERQTQYHSCGVLATFQIIMGALRHATIDIQRFFALCNSNETKMWQPSL